MNTALKWYGLLMPEFKLHSPFKLTGDQPQAVEKLTEGIRQNLYHQTLLGVTGSGKTFNMASIIEKVQRPTLIMAPNKTLAAQLHTEFSEFFPDNAVEYFVSYYDYYQPEAYVPRTDTYIEKDADINEEIDKLRHAATRSLLTRRDVLIVASVSCIYGLGSPEEYHGFVSYIENGGNLNRDSLIRDLVDMQYERNDLDISRGKFRIKGDTLEILPAYETVAIRIEFWGNQVDRIQQIDPLTGEILGERDNIEIYPAKHFVTSDEKMQMALKDIEIELAEQIKWLRGKNKLIEAQRLEQRTNYDLEMMRETGYCSGVENYSCHLGRRHNASEDHLAISCGSTPWTLLHYFPDDFLLFIDESHMSLPQIRGMYHGDSSRKQTLVNYGFRLPSAMDNRPLNFGEFESRVNQVVYVSATPGPYEFEHTQQLVEQIIRPTGLIDPLIEIRPTQGQIDHLLEQIKIRVAKEERCLITTLTKRMAEELADYLREMGCKTHYLHSEQETLKRVEVLRDLRLGIYDVVVGINLLREGLDLPEVSLVAILDADKEGYLRSDTSLIQTIGRAARHINGTVIMYADVITKSMRRAIDETNRRREIQSTHNKKHGITPQGIQKAVKDITQRAKSISQPNGKFIEGHELPKDDILRIIKELEANMKSAAKNLEFEKAALLRDHIIDLRKVIKEE